MRSLYGILCCAVLAVMTTAAPGNGDEPERHYTPPTGPIAGIVIQGNGGNDLPLRARPNGTAEVVEFLKAGEATSNYNRFQDGFVQVYSPVNGAWAEISRLQPIRGKGTVIAVDKPDNCLRVRTGPGNTFERITCLAKDTSIELTGIWSENNWAEIDSPVKGWVYGDQISSTLLASEEKEQDSEKDAAGLDDIKKLSDTLNDLESLSSNALSLNDTLESARSGLTERPTSEGTTTGISSGSGRPTGMGTELPFGISDYPGGGMPYNPLEGMPFTSGGIPYAGSGLLGTPGTIPLEYLAALAEQGGMQVLVGRDGSTFVGVGGPYGVNVGVAPDGGTYVGVGGTGVGVGYPPGTVIAHTGGNPLIPVVTGTSRIQSEHTLAERSSSVPPSRAAQQQMSPPPRETTRGPTRLGSPRDHRIRSIPHTRVGRSEPRPTSEQSMRVTNRSRSAAPQHADSVEHRPAREHQRIGRPPTAEEWTDRARSEVLQPENDFRRQRQLFNSASRRVSPPDVSSRNLRVGGVRPPQVPDYREPGRRYDQAAPGRNDLRVGRPSNIPGDFSEYAGQAPQLPRLPGGQPDIPIPSGRNLRVPRIPENARAALPRVNPESLMPRTLPNAGSLGSALPGMAGLPAAALGAVPFRMAPPIPPPPLPIGGPPRLPGLPGL
jgi:hypothetical protein